MWELLEVVIVLLLAFLMGVCLLIGWWIVWRQPAAEGKRLWEIENVVGKPKSWNAIGENRFIYSWHAQKYDVTLVFSGEICEGISNETSV